MGGVRDVDPGAPVQPRGPVRRWFAGLGVSQVRRLVIVVILAVTALFGGLDTVDTTVTDFKPGEAFSDGEFTVTIDRASLASEVRAGSTLVAPAKPGRRYLGIVATVRNDGTIPGFLRNELDLRDQPDKESMSAFRISDGSPISALGPGLTEQLAFLWELPENAVEPGDSVTVRIWKKQYRELLVTYGKAWLDSLTDYGQTVIPVKALS